MRQLTPYEQTQLARYSPGTSPDPTTLGSTPIEYVTGKAEFCGLVLAVSPAVLIPRVETEELVALALQAIAEKINQASTEQPLVIAEVGTGSGAISIAVAKHTAPFANRLKLLASDVSPEALAIAHQNSALVTSQDTPLHFFESDLLASYPSDKIDLLIANLPYIPSHRIVQLDSAVKDHEPHLALDGGPTGFSLIVRLLDQASTKLSSNGVVLLELDETHGIANFSSYANIFSIEILPDSFGKTRFALLRKK